MKRMTKAARGSATRGVESRFRLNQQVKGGEREKEREKERDKERKGRGGHCERDTIIPPHLQSR